jgi:protein-S-isoprenylcysteine O-methyltransferase Ste14
LGSEHLLCDKIQLILIALFFAVWGIDSSSFFIFGYSTVIFEALAFPALFAGALLFFYLSFYLVSKSHKAVLEQVQDPPVLVDSGVYAWVRHPLYLGTLLFCLAFLFIDFSLVSCVILFSFFFFYDRMATYEEKSLTEILGEDYLYYQKRVSKWFPKLFNLGDTRKWQN